MKHLLTAVIAVAAIVAIKMILSYVFTYPVGEIYFRVSITALFFYYVFMVTDKKPNSEMK